MNGAEVGDPAVQLEPVPIRVEGQSQIVRPGRDRKIRDRRTTAKHAMASWVQARQPIGLIGDPPPLHPFVERRWALLQGALPLSRARS